MRGEIHLLNIAKINQPELVVQRVEQDSRSDGHRADNMNGGLQEDSQTAVDTGFFRRCARDPRLQVLLVRQ
jgi:hypothetical protein